MNPTSRPHDEAVVEQLREEPAFSAEYLGVALGEADDPDGQEALQRVLHHVAEGQGMGKIAELAGLPRESLYKSLSAKGNPMLKTLLAMRNASGVRLSITGGDPHQGTPT